MKLLVSKFDKQVGLKFLRGMHLNDSKMNLNSRRDRHENIGLYVFYNAYLTFTPTFLCRGYLGIRTFSHLLSDPRVQDIPLILETQSFEKPKEVWGKEIQVLQRLVAAETDGLTDVEEKELADSVRDVLKLAGGSTVNKKPRTSKATSRRKTSSKRKEADQGSEEDDSQEEDEEQ